MRMNSITTLMAEVHAIENSYSAYLEGLRTVSKNLHPMAFQVLGQNSSRWRQKTNNLK